MGERKKKKSQGDNSIKKDCSSGWGGKIQEKKEKKKA